MLDFARLRWNSPGRKEAAIREQFGLSSTMYYQRLVALLADPEAEAYDPVTVRRLRRLASRRR